MQDKDQGVVLFSAKTIWNRWFHHTEKGMRKICAVVLKEFSYFLLMILLYTKIDNIAGWTLYEIACLQGLLLITGAFSQLFFSELIKVTLSEQNRMLQRFLLKPKGVLTQILLADTKWFQVIGCGVPGMALLVLGLIKCGVEMSVGKVIFLLFCLAGGTLIRAAVQLASAALQLYAGHKFNLNDTIFSAAQMMVYFPIVVFPEIMQYYCVYFIPMAFVSYFPAAVLLHKTATGFPHFYGYLTFPIGVLLYLLSYLFWRIGLKRFRQGR